MEIWQLICLLFFLGVGGFILLKLERVLTLLQSVERTIQWGSPQIRERRPTATAQHRGEG